jgi:chaperonin cofactor prefoldin
MLFFLFQNATLIADNSNLRGNMSSMSEQCEKLEKQLNTLHSHNSQLQSQLTSLQSHNAQLQVSKDSALEKG